jgi:hypothetical protein
MTLDELLDQNVRRLEDWAAREGTRRHLAAAMVDEARQALSGAALGGFVHRAFVWEVSGERVELERCTARLMEVFECSGGRFRVHDPNAIGPTVTAGGQR